IPGQGYVTVVTSTTVSLSPTAAMATPLRFQATKLGEYLLVTNKGKDTTYQGANWDKRGFLAAASVAGLSTTNTVQEDAAPSTNAEWRLVANAPKANNKTKGKQTQTYLLSIPSRSVALTAVSHGAALAAGKGSPVVLRLAAKCAVLPEMDTNTVGRPAATKGSSTGPVQGFFEAHVHGMAFEFLGGKLRCGSPWHKYGVEYALPDCSKTGNPFNGALEVPLGGQSPEYTATYSPVGWPTFKSWPENHTLTHEQYYYRWLERAYLGGLRLTTNLLVDNSALCNIYPVKKNSCNEMDGVRLQAKRMFELQDYIDAQSGGPGEGWLRVVSTPTQARQVIHASRLAVILGIEVSELFDCREILDQPQCTTKQIDDRLQEAYDMGVRQMELVNKFDNALSGVTGDGGTTGAVVNSGNRQVTQHFWDMQTCPEKAPAGKNKPVSGDQHDRTHSNVGDVTPGNGEGIDALAGRVLDTFGGATKGYVTPLYGPGPHCNSRGLTTLGRHIIKTMIAKGMIFDPDHMSETAQREALDMIQSEIIPAELAAAKKEKRAPILPALMSSHSWANDVIYQRIYQLDGVVAPRTADAASFVKDWIAHKEWAAKQAPKGYAFGMGYGADTNGLGGQPGPRSKAKNKVDYAKGFTSAIGNVKIKQQQIGLRKTDINVEGVSEYGMFADWFEELRVAADEVKPGLGKQIIADMLNGPETYLTLWERAVYGAGPCVHDQSGLQYEDVSAALGGNQEGFEHAIGKPSSRENDPFNYCGAK
ncbi:MAG: hypothetical protein ABIO67_03080, partial [Mycobacteriales bacterium]